MSPATIGAIIQLVALYGPEVLTGIEGLFTKSNPTIADIQAVFVNLKPYSAFNIPPTPPAVASVAAA
jgi:hypothetical protein